MSPSSLFQFIIGFFLGVILFGASIAGGAYFFLTNISATPSKHSFKEEKPSSDEPKKEVATAPKPVSETEVKKPEAETKPESENLPKDAYKARVTWSTGLSLRSDPSTDAQRIGGVDYNAELIILSTSNDNQWQKVRIPTSGQEGWVKSGNIEKIN